ncbi:DUF4440 domain-containing protein [Microbacterium hydrocarbonoxydans]|uniref:DUF4440 domain-containing protein n=1 Tax=Microbacterium hydrocarbonoxydans TaxID=273678 RepID=UPI0013DD7EE5|nr:DUF4440 domain-containing protein [Microbacterium hydrocarbonoxydans]
MSELEREELIELERRGWDALCESRGGVFYRDLMSPDAVMVLVDGSVLGREEIAASLDGVPRWTSYEIAEAGRIPVDDRSSALVYRARAFRDGQAPFEALMTSVYTVVGGRVRLALHQQTAVST